MEGARGRTYLLSLLDRIGNSAKLLWIEIIKDVAISYVRFLGGLSVTRFFNRLQKADSMAFENRVTCGTQII